jgi:asparagine synthase (glutamine-hydrolysing)
VTEFMGSTRGLHLLQAVHGCPDDASARGTCRLGITGFIEVFGLEWCFHRGFALGAPKSETTSRHIEDFMSGVFGIVDLSREIDAWALAGRMTAAMSHRDWFVADRFVDRERNLAIGRIGIGIFNHSPQPVWNSSHTVALLMAGEFYNEDAPGRDGCPKSNEQVALALYEKLGDDFANQLNGAFIIAIWDETRNQLLIANDRFGLYPLFYSCRNRRLIFAPEMKGILCDETFPRTLDLTALAQYVRFQHLFGERTFFEDIELLPSASLLVYDPNTASCSVRRYWTFDDIPYRPKVSFDEAVEEVGLLLRRAVQRLSSDAYRPGVYLSGGLDSRTILGMIKRRPVVSLTYGTHNCRDVYYARRIAKATGSDHHWFDLGNGEWVKECADLHLDLTEGFHSWIHSHGISTLPQARQLMDVNLTGWDGGTVMGHPDSVEPLQVSAVDDAALITRMFCLFNQEYTWPSMTEAEESLLYCEPIHRKIQGRAFDSFRAEVARFLNYRSDVRGEYFYIYNHCRRLTQNLVTFIRSHIEVRFPFFDYDLFDFLYSLPALVRGQRALYLAVIQRETPRLTYIPYDHDELLPTPKSLLRQMHALPMRLKRRFNRHLWTVSPERNTLYADYENYLRGKLRDWAEDILFNRRTSERGIFDPVFLRSLMDRHLSGLEEWTIGKIAPIMTYEMMLRRFYN